MNSATSPFGPYVLAHFEKEHAKKHTPEQCVRFRYMISVYLPKLAVKAQERTNFWGNLFTEFPDLLISLRKLKRGEQQQQQQQQKKRSREETTTTSNDVQPPQKRRAIESADEKARHDVEQCYGCMENRAKTVTLPCFCGGLCLTCSKTQKSTCWRCSGPITEIKQIFS